MATRQKAVIACVCELALVGICGDGSGAIRCFHCQSGLGSFSAD